MKQIAGIFFMALLAGCATTNHQSSIHTARDSFMSADVAKDPSYATVYIYRDKQYFGHALHPTVMLGDADLVEMGDGTFYVGRFPPGHHRFRMDDGKSGADVDLKPGAIYYFKVNLVPGFWKGGGQIVVVTPEQAGYEIRQTAPIAISRIPDKSHTPEGMLVPFTGQ